MEPEPETRQMDMNEHFMKEALRLAKKGRGRTSPNPSVGAVIVRNGSIIASGYHRRAGEKHAEVEALSQFSGPARKGDTLYVTLEPCNHHGRTPPCTEAILRSGIGRVVVGMGDPNPKVSGGGCEYLVQKGLDVKQGVLEMDCRRLNEAFVTFVTKGRPFIIAKSAMTLDGWTATSTGHSRWITNERSRQFVHRLRDRVDGVIVGCGTVIADDPMLTTRLKNRRGKDPLRIIVDTQFKTPLNAKVLNHHSASMTLIVAGDHVPQEHLRRIPEKGVSAIGCPTRDDRIDLRALMDILGNMSLLSLMLEGGSTLMGSMIRARLVDKFYLFKAPKLLGGGDGLPMALGLGPERMDQALGLKEIKTRRFGDDLLIRGYPDY
ncbi:bifunctional diaminohydroxyphosphoribosylaminopyrimidine deaminase/5-amino-6-(5-phosphoribosylamino)uracil reductase RibD [Thermodesulfobacteriota bacterium]